MRAERVALVKASSAFWAGGKEGEGAVLSERFNSSGKDTVMGHLIF